MARNNHEVTQTLRKQKEMRLQISTPSLQQNMIKSANTRQIKSAWGTGGKREQLQQKSGSDQT